MALTRKQIADQAARDLKLDDTQRRLLDAQVDTARVLAGDDPEGNADLDQAIADAETTSAEIRARHEAATSD